MSRVYGKQVSKGLLCTIHRRLYGVNQANRGREVPNATLCNARGLGRPSQHTENKAPQSGKTGGLLYG